LYKIINGMGSGGHALFKYFSHAGMTKLDVFTSCHFNTI